jgi:hypothetical protein
MVEVIPADFIHEQHGKMSGKSNGYFHMSRKTGKMYFRSREEGNQAKQSPRQKCNSAAFAYAHKQLHAIEANTEMIAQMESDFKTANGKAPTTRHTPPPMLGNSIRYFWNGNKKIRLTHINHSMHIESNIKTY